VATTPLPARLRVSPFNSSYNIVMHRSLTMNVYVAACTNPVPTGTIERTWQGCVAVCPPSYIRCACIRIHRIRTGELVPSRAKSFLGQRAAV
jgi:hypothetical protein